MTPLFPTDKETLTIMQGKVGDCYLLASLDCIFNLGSEGRAFIKKLFTENKDGSVTLRIKRTELSANLKPSRLVGKYEYKHDTETNEDVFIIGEEKLTEIDGLKDGVQTNSLAVKILEHITSYYFISEGESSEPFISLKAHGARRLSETSSLFVGKLFGIDAYDSFDIAQMIKLKTINPEQPIYISMRWGKTDSHGVDHGRHSLRIKRIVPKVDGDHEFVLVNPWDNKTEEIFSLKEIEKRNYRFCNFSIDKAKHAVTCDVLACPEKQGIYVFANPELLNIFIHMQKTTIILSPKIIESCIKLHQQTPSLPLLFKALIPLDQRKLMDIMVDTAGDKEKFLMSVIKTFPYFHIVKIIIEQDLSHDLICLVLKKLAAEAKSNRLHPFHSLVANPIFLKMVVNAAIHHKKVQLDGDVDEARKAVEPGLASFYFSGDSSHVTRTSGLRALVEENIITKSGLKELLAPQMLLAKAIANVFSNDFHPLDETEQYVKAINKEAINEELLNEILKNVTCEKPEQLFVGIKKLSVLNPDGARVLFSVAAKKMESIFLLPFYRYKTSLSKEEPNAFKTWFLGMLKLINAHKYIDCYVERINLFKVRFNDITTLADVAIQRKSLITQLHDMINSGTELTEARHTLGLVDQPLAVSKALANKIQLIDEAADRQNLNIDKAQKVLAFFEQKINAFRVNFDNVTSVSAVLLHKTALIIRLKELEKIIRNDKECIQALEILQIPFTDSTVHNVLSAKLLEINLTWADKYTKIHRATPVRVMAADHFGLFALKTSAVAAALESMPEISVCA